MNNGATSYAVTHPVTPAQIKVGRPGGRPVRQPGRAAAARPAERADVRARYLAAGPRPPRPDRPRPAGAEPGPARARRLTGPAPAHHGADRRPRPRGRRGGRLATPVLAGHSQSGGFASVYAAQYPASGVINVEASPDLWTLVQVIQGLAASCGGDVLEVWRKMEQTFGLHLLPAETREFIMRHQPAQEGSSRQLLGRHLRDDTGAGIGNGERRGRRYHRGRGALPADPRFRAVAGYRRLVRERRAARDRRGLGGQRALPAHRAPSEVRRATSGYRVSTVVLAGPVRAGQDAGTPLRSDRGKDPALRAGDGDGPARWQRHLRWRGRDRRPNL